MLWLLGYNLSVAGAVGFIALAGVAAEFGVIMVLYLNQALDKYRQQDPEGGNRMIMRAIHEGAVRRDDYGGLTADYVGRRQRFRGHAAHRRADDRGNGHRALIVDVSYSRTV
ncbi:Cation efflux system protein CusA [compost metagenome]